jgi:trigger factor
MKTEFVDVNETRKNLVVEIPSTVVDAEIDKIARDYGKAARIPGFRPGKVPAKVVRQRFRDQILHDVAHGLIPRAVDEALRERGVEPVDTPDIKDVVCKGQPPKFSAKFARSRRSIQPAHSTRAGPAVDEVAVSRRLPISRARRGEPVENRGIPRRLVVMDLVRRRPANPRIMMPRNTMPRTTPEERQPPERDFPWRLAQLANPPGFDAELVRG